MFKRYTLFIIFISVGSLESASSRCRQAGQRLYQRMLGLRKQAHIRTASTLKNPAPCNTGAQQQQKSYQKCWDRCKKPILGIAATGITAGAVQFLLERNRHMQEELKQPIDQKNDLIDQLDKNDTWRQYHQFGGDPTVWETYKERYKKEQTLQQKANKDLQEVLRQKTLSGIHYRKNPSTGGLCLRRKVDDAPLLIKYQFIEALKKEEQLLQQGYICFYHAQHSTYGSINDVTNAVFFKLAGKQQPDDFRLLQIRPQDFEQKPVSLRNQEHEFFMQGNSDNNPTPLSVNLFAFGNEGYRQDEGSSTLHYLSTNRSNYRFTPDILIDTLSAMGLPEAQSKALRTNEKFKSLVDNINIGLHYGRLLLIAIPQEAIDTYVFPACWAEKVTTKDGQVIDRGNQRKPITVGKKTLHKVTDIIEYAQKSSVASLEQLKFECNMPITTVGLLNPYSDIKIVAIDNQCISVENKIQLDKAKQDLVDFIMAEFETTGVLEKAQKIVRDHLTELAIIAKSNKDLSNDSFLESLCSRLDW